MERYSSYKPTSMQWLKEIPSHWKEMRHKYCLPMVKDKSTLPFKVGLENIESYSGLYIPTESLYEGDGINAKEGDIVYGKLRPYLAKVWIADRPCNAVGDFFVYRCNKDCILNQYAKWLMLSDGFTKICSASTYGAKMPRVSSDFIASLSIPLPPLVEQEKIVSYLEDKTSKIDAYVADKEKEIELLQELKQKTIADAVTKGLNPDAKMEDYSSLISSSCLEHWKIVRNKSFLSLTGEKVGKKASEFVLLSLTTKGVIVRDIESGKGKFPKDFDTYQIVKPNELVFCLFDIDETPRTVGLVETEGMLTGAYTVFKVHTELAMPEYIYNYYLCVDNIKALKPYYSGLRKTVRADKFQQIYMPLPPLDEQQSIVAYLEEKCEKIDKLASELQSEIDYLKEYKQRLIADCVTGQVNVSGV